MSTESVKSTSHSRDRSDMILVFNKQFDDVQQKFNELNKQDLILLKEAQYVHFLQHDYARNMQNLVDTSLFSKEEEQFQVEVIINNFKDLKLDSQKLEIKEKKKVIEENESEKSE